MNSAVVYSLILIVPAFGERLRRALRWPKNPSSPSLFTVCIALSCPWFRGQYRKRVACRSRADGSRERNGWWGGEAGTTHSSLLPPSPSPLPLLCPGYEACPHPEPPTATSTNVPGHCQPLCTVLAPPIHVSHLSHPSFSSSSTNPPSSSSHRHHDCQAPQPRAQQEGPRPRQTCAVSELGM